LERPPDVNTKQKFLESQACKEVADPGPGAGLTNFNQSGPGAGLTNFNQSGPGPGPGSENTQ
jgi:hypothetical protein